jgi:hypothetical protein
MPPARSAERWEVGVMVSEPARPTTCPNCDQVYDPSRTTYCDKCEAAEVNAENVKGRRS